MLRGVERLRNHHHHHPLRFCLAVDWTWTEQGQQEATDRMRNRRHRRFPPLTVHLPSRSSTAALCMSLFVEQSQLIWECKLVSAMVLFSLRRSHSSEHITD